MREPFVRHDRSSTKLEQKGAGPGARSSHAITLVGSTAYSLGGEFTPRLPVDSTMYAFDLKAQSWSALDSAGQVPLPLVGVDGTVFVFGVRVKDHKLYELCFDTTTNMTRSCTKNDPPILCTN